MGHVFSRKGIRRYVATEEFAQWFPTLFHVENKKLFSGDDGLNSLVVLPVFHPVESCSLRIDASVNPLENGVDKMS